VRAGQRAEGVAQAVLGARERHRLDEDRPRRQRAAIDAAHQPRLHRREVRGQVARGDKGLPPARDDGCIGRVGHGPFVAAHRRASPRADSACW
jgi:hypothetical protein